MLLWVSVAIWVVYFVFWYFRPRCARCYLIVPLRSGRRKRWRIARVVVNGQIKNLRLCACCNFEIKRAAEEIVDEAEKRGLL